MNGIRFLAVFFSADTPNRQAGLKFDYLTLKPLLFLRGTQNRFGIISIKPVCNSSEENTQCDYLMD